MKTLRTRLASEFLGTAFLLAAVIGSGIMGERLASGNVAIALLANTIATGAALVALILTFRPISGARFNPVVTLADAWERGIPWAEAVQYSSRTRSSVVPFAVGAYITAAYWFTASTSFANPAVTIARCISDTFAGIRPIDVPWFVLTQFLGGFAATLVFRWFVPNLQVRAKEILQAHDLEQNRES